jgi:Uncharacterized protein conserved in bacteria
MTVVALLIAAGGAIVLQNLMMTQIASSASTPLVALALNSLVGLALLLSLIAWRSGAAGFAELTATFGWRAALPGLLGTFFVFASLLGYQRLGAGTTVALLVASQLIAGLLIDALRTGAARLDSPDLIRRRDADRRHGLVATRG